MKIGKLTRALTVCLILTAALSLGVTALAAEIALPASDWAGGTITVTLANEAGGAEQTPTAVTAALYQTVTVNTGALSNGTTYQPQTHEYMWSTEAAAWVQANYPAYIGDDGEVLRLFSTATSADVKAFYDAMAAAVRGGTLALTAKATQPGGAGGAVTFTGVGMGSYLILAHGGTMVYQPAAANIIPAVKNSAWVIDAAPSVYVKASPVGIEKKIVSGAGKSDAASHNIGDTVRYEITADVPEYPVNARSKGYEITDTLSDGLTLTADTVKVYGVKGAAETLLTAGTDYTRGTKDRAGEDVSFAISFAYDAQLWDSAAAAPRYEKIVVRYDAVLNEHALIGAKNGNEAVLSYSNDPYSADNWTTDTDGDTAVYTYGLALTKVDKESGDPLLYAEFSVRADGGDEIRFVPEGGVYRKALTDDETGATTVLVTDADGKLKVTGLAAGKYAITETKAPEGYMLLSGSIEKTLTDAKTYTVDGEGVVTAAESAPDGILDDLTDENKVVDEDGVYEAVIPNERGFELPHTGGMGTEAFTAAGLALALLSAASLGVRFARKKSGA